MKKLYLYKSFNEIFISPKTYNENPEIKIRTILGKENVHLNRQWTHHGGGGIYTWYTVTNLEGAKEHALSYGYEIIMEEKQND